MKEGPHIKSQRVRKVQNGPPYLSSKKTQADSKRKDMDYSNMFSENIINLTCCIIIKMPTFREDNFCAGRTKCRSPMFLMVNL